MKDDSRSDRSRWIRWLVIAVGLVAVVVIAILVSRRAVLAAPPQPLPFSHRRHDQSGIQCLYCHSDALRSDIAGIPSVQKCMGCHSSIATDRPAIVELTGYWERQEPILWQRVSPSADFVFFSHQPHLAAAVSCETCHGDVGSMDAARPATIMDMGWCLNCHLQQPTEKVARLADCMACHK